MTHTATAIYENGTLKLTKPIKGIPEHAVVRINFETVEKLTKKQRLAMLATVPVAEELADAIEEGRKNARGQSKSFNFLL